jgi:hypothetical protein
LHNPDELTLLPSTSGRRGIRITAATVMAAGVLLAPGLATTADAATSSAVVADTTTPTTCSKGYANTYEFYTLCKGTSPAGYRTIAYCANGEAVLGVEYAVNSGSISYADCAATGGMNSTLSTLGWGILYCSNFNGSGSFGGYFDTTGDISTILLNWGAQNITTGGTTLCEYSIGTAQAISPTTPA